MVEPPNRSAELPLRVGLWLPLQQGAHWRGEGIARTVTSIIGGMAEQGILDECIELVVYTTHWAVDEIRESFEYAVKDRIGRVEFVVLTGSLGEYVLGPAWRVAADVLCSGPQRLVPSEDYRIDAQRRRNYARVVRYFWRRSDVKFGDPRRRHPVLLVKPTTSSAPVRWLFERRVRRVLEDYALTKRQLVGMTRHLLSQDRKQFSKSPSDRLGEQLKTSLNRIPLVGRFTRGLWSRYELFKIVHGVARVTNSRSRHPDVWWSPSPVTIGAELLPGPKLVNFWDFFGGQFGYYWPGHELQQIFFRCNLVLSTATNVITQSKSNKYFRIKTFQVPPEKAYVCHLSYPKHYADFVPLFAKTGQKTPETRRQAATTIRDEMRKRMRSDTRDGYMPKVGLPYDVLEQFPFEHEKFILVSTQNRPYKNLTLVVDLLPKVMSELGEEVFLMMTADLDLTNTKDKLARTILKHGLADRVFSLPRISDKVHAALYHCAAVSIHPSLAEGGIGTYPFLEGMVMGTASLSLSGDHTTEAAGLVPGYGRTVLPRSDKRAAVAMVVAALRDPEATFRAQKPLFDSQLEWEWGEAGRFYAEVLRQTAGRPPDLAYLDSADMHAKARFYQLNVNMPPAQVFGVGQAGFNGEKTERCS